MLEIVKNEDNKNYVTAHLTADDLIDIMVANATTYPRQGYMCINLVPVICAKATKKAKRTPIFEYSEDESDDNVTMAVMAWLDSNLISKRAKTFKQVGSVEEVFENGYVSRNQYTKHFNEEWLETRAEKGKQVLESRKKNPNFYSYRHLCRIGILDEIRSGKNLPLTVEVKVRERGSYAEW